MSDTFLEWCVCQLPKVNSKYFSPFLFHWESKEETKKNKTYFCVEHILRPLQHKFERCAIVPHNTCTGYAQLRIIWKTYMYLDGTGKKCTRCFLEEAPLPRHRWIQLNFTLPEKWTSSRYSTLYEYSFFGRNLSSSRISRSGESIFLEMNFSDSELSPLSLLSFHSIA